MSRLSKYDNCAEPCNLPCPVASMGEAAVRAVGGVVRAVDPAVEGTQPTRLDSYSAFMIDTALLVEEMVTVSGAGDDQYAAIQDAAFRNLTHACPNSRAYGG